MDEENIKNEEVTEVEEIPKKRTNILKPVKDESIWRWLLRYTLYTHILGMIYAIALVIVLNSKFTGIGFMNTNLPEKPDTSLYGESCYCDAKKRYNLNKIKFHYRQNFYKKQFVKMEYANGAGDEFTEHERILKHCPVTILAYIQHYYEYLRAIKGFREGEFK